MKELLVQYAAFNAWADSQLLATILSLTEEQQQQEIVSSFPSLYKTLLHMLDASSIWWQRVKLQERIIRPSDGFTGDMKELAARIQKQDRDWIDWVTNAQEHMLQHVFQYQNTKKETFKQPVFQMLMHLFNHGTYHRGQLVTLLRQLNMDKIPATDFIVWSRKK